MGFPTLLQSQIIRSGCGHLNTGLSSTCLVDCLFFETDSLQHQQRNGQSSANLSNKQKSQATVHYLVIADSPATWNALGITVLLEE